MTRVKIFVTTVLLFGVLVNEVQSQNTGPNTIDYVGSQPPAVTNMVSLPTGDFSYLLNLMSVPGPEGNFPIQLIYRSGVTIDQEAAWVGLGWSLFPGAITRTVNGVPDDWKEKKVYNILNYTTSHNEHTVIPGNGLSGYASLGLQKLLGYNRSFFGYNKKTWRDSDLATKYYSGPLYFKDVIKNANEDNSEYGGIRILNGYCMDTYSSLGEDGDISDANPDNLEGNNSLIFPNYDQYVVNAGGLSGTMSPRIQELAVLTGNGKTISKDEYGNVEEELSYHYNSVNDPKCSLEHNEIYFNFDYSHDSYLKVKSGTFDDNNGSQNPPMSDPNNRFKLDDDAGNLESEIPASILSQYNESSNYNAEINRRGGARHVEWFTNYDLVNSKEDAVEKGFIEAECEPIPNRSNSDLFDPDGIGAFVITAADGSRYHFSLPVYQFEQFTRDEQSSGDFYERRQLDKYAYSWLLTAITGPDYVDDGDDVINGGDFGFWIKFTYGKWTDGFIWRTPYEDEASGAYHYYNEQETHNISHWGRKQIYYLNSIVTRSHTAYFIKSLRNDAKSKNLIYEPEEFYGVKNSSLEIYEQGVTPIQDISWLHSLKYVTDINIQNTHQVLKLDKIIIVANEDAVLSTQNISNLCTSLNSTISFQTKYENISSPEEGVVISKQYLPVDSRSFYMNMQDNVLDIYDLSDTDDDNIPDIQEHAVRTVEMNYDYSLADGVPNATDGRLTLKKVLFKDKENEDLMPSYDFSYKLYDSYNFDDNNWDNWGYIPNQNATAWNLNQIWTPEGGKINVEYEPDDCKYEYTKINNNEGSFNGGIRVKQIYSDDGKGNVYRTCYNYNIPNGLNGSGTSSGVTSFEPERIYNRSYIQDLPMPDVLYGYVTIKNFGADYQLGDETDNEPDEETTYVFDVPAAMSADADEKELSFGQFFNVEQNQYSYGVANENTEDYVDNTLFDFGNGLYQNFYLNSMTIHDNTSAIGRSLGIISKNKSGQTIGEIYFDYLARNMTSGQFQETFLNRKHHLYKADATIPIAHKWYLTCASKILYPSVVKAVISIDNGIPLITENKKYDFNTGNVIESEQANIKMIKVPAYTKYSEMGSKTEEITNKNMLSQVTASYSVNKNDSILSYGIQTWKKNWQYLSYNPFISDYSKSLIAMYPEIYKQYQTYIWNGEIRENGTIKNYKPFNWSETEAYNESRGWKKVKEVDLYNKYSKPLDVQDINGNFTSVKFGYDEKYVLSGIANSNYKCFGYTGFEYSRPVDDYTDYDGGFINKDIYSTLMLSDNASEEYDGTGFVETGINAHTGNYYLKISGGSGPKFKMIYDADNPELGLKAGTYRASAWVRVPEETEVKMEVIPNIASLDDPDLDDYSITYDPNATDKIDVEGWSLLTFDFVIPETLSSGDYINLCISSLDGIAYIDDFRVHPVDAPMTANVYNVKTGLISAVLDENNFATFYEYDEAGRLLRLKKETINYGIQIVKEYDYNYARQN
jgi:hypothetical protein